MGHRSANEMRINAAIYQDMQARIVSGEYSPGEWISVEALCRKFEVSRQPVMEAMRRLSSDWLIDIIPQVGCRVASYDESSLLDYINTFGEVEAEIATMAAERRTPAQLERLSEVADRIRQRDKLDADNFNLGRDYHRIVLEMAHSTVLARLCEQLWFFGTFASNIVTPFEMTKDLLQRRSETIDRLTDAIKAKNGKLARLQMAIWLMGLDRSFANGE